MAEPARTVSPGPDLRLPAGLEEEGRLAFQPVSLICDEVLGECPKPLLVPYIFVCLCFNKMGMAGVWCEISYYRNSLDQTILVPKLLPCFKSGAHGAAFKPVIYRAIFCQAGVDPAPNNVELNTEEGRKSFLPWEHLALGIFYCKQLGVAVQPQGIGLEPRLCQEPVCSPLPLTHPGPWESL